MNEDKKSNNKILVIIPHSSIKRPKEIKKQWLSKNQRRLLYSETAETDRYTDKLYDFRKFIKNKQIIFPYSIVYLNICRDPKKIKDIVPINIRGVEIYKKNKTPSIALRKRIYKKYSSHFFGKIHPIKRTLILEGHSTMAGHPSLDRKLVHNVILSNFFYIGRSKKKFVSCPIKILKIYADELKKELPNIKIGFNSAYLSVYDSILFKFGSDRLGRKNRAPIIHQETDESLYITKNKLNNKKINKLQRAFARALYNTFIKTYKT